MTSMSGGTTALISVATSEGLHSDDQLDARELRRLARRMSARATWEGLDSVVERSWRLLARTDMYDAWLIAWPAGGAIELHDHGGSSGAIVVVSGALTESRPERINSDRL